VPSKKKGERKWEIAILSDAQQPERENEPKNLTPRSSLGFSSFLSLRL